MCAKIRSKPVQILAIILADWITWEHIKVIVIQGSAAKTSVKQNYNVIQEERKAFNTRKVKKRTYNEIAKTWSIQEVRSKKTGIGNELKWRKCHLQGREINCLGVLCRGITWKLYLPWLLSVQLLHFISRACQNNRRDSGNLNDQKICQSGAVVQKFKTQRWYKHQIISTEPVCFMSIFKGLQQFHGHKC